MYWKIYRRSVCFHHIFGWKYHKWARDCLRVATELHLSTLLPIDLWINNNVAGRQVCRILYISYAHSIKLTFCWCDDKSNLDVSDFEIFNLHICSWHMHDAITCHFTRDIKSRSFIMIIYYTFIVFIIKPNCLAERFHIPYDGVQRNLSDLRNIVNSN